MLQLVYMESVRMLHNTITPITQFTIIQFSNLDIQFLTIMVTTDHQSRREIHTDHHTGHLADLHLDLDLDHHTDHLSNLQ